MTITGYFFSLSPGKKFKLLTEQEQDGLFCLLDRARQYGGKNDILFLCLSNCSLLVQFLPDSSDTLKISGFAFQKKEEPWLWIWLPTLIGTVPDAVQLQKNISMKSERANAMAAWSKKHHPSLWDSAQQLKQDTLRRMQPYSVGFTSLSPSLYGDEGIHWYNVEKHTEEANTRLLTLDDLDRWQAEDHNIYISPPRLIGGWRAVQEDKKIKLGTIEPVSDWYSFAERIRKEIL